MDRGCGRDPCVDGAQTEDGCARRGALAGLVAERAFSAHLEADVQERDLQQLVWHRQKLVWMRNAVGNQLHALAMGEGVWCSDASCHSSGCKTRPWNLPSCHGSNIRR